MTDGFKELMSAQTTDHIIELIPTVARNMNKELKKEKRFICELQAKLIKRKGNDYWKLNYEPDLATEHIKTIIYNEIYAAKNSMCRTCGKDFHQISPGQYRSYCSTKCFSEWGNQYCTIYWKGKFSHYGTV